MFCTKERLEELRRLYPAGCRVMLDRMDDSQAPPLGSFGTVHGVDDAGNIMVQWDTGSGLNVVDGVDLCHRITPVPNTRAVAQKLHAFCKEVHYRQAPATIGCWQPGVLSETEARLYWRGGNIRIIKGVLQFAAHANEADQKKAKEILLLLAENYKDVYPFMGMAMALIDDFLRREYKMDAKGDYEDLSMVSIAYTSSDGSVTVQVFVDLLDYRMITYVDGEEAEVRCYRCLEELISEELRFLDFECLVDIGRWEAKLCG